MSPILTPAPHLPSPRLQVLRDLSVLKRRMVREDGTWDVVVIASRLAAMGHQVALRTALGGGRGQECFHHLHHEFLVVTTPETQDELILDPSFREQFEIPHATVPYQQVGAQQSLLARGVLCAQVVHLPSGLNQSCFDE